MTERHADLKKKVEDAEQQHQALLDSITELELDHNKKSKEASRLEQRLEELEADLQTIAKGTDLARQAKAGLDGEVCAIRETLATLQNEQIDLEGQLTAGAASRDQVLFETDNLQKELSKRQLELSAKNTELIAIGNLVQEAQAQLDQSQVAKIAIYRPCRDKCKGGV